MNTLSRFGVALLQSSIIAGLSAVSIGAMAASWNIVEGTRGVESTQAVSHNHNMFQHGNGVILALTTPAQTDPTPAVVEENGPSANRITYTYAVLHGSDFVHNIEALNKADQTGVEDKTRGAYEPCDLAAGPKSF